MEIIDNINRLLGDDLKGAIKPGAKLKIAAASFSIYAFEALSATPVNNRLNDLRNQLALAYEGDPGEPLRAVFRDASFASDSVKINVEQIFKLISPVT